MSTDDHHKIVEDLIVQHGVPGARTRAWEKLLSLDLNAERLTVWTRVVDILGAMDTTERQLNDIEWLQPHLTPCRDETTARMELMRSFSGRR